jgi:hypothetical protein
MKRTLHLSESELITLIQKIINEQQTMGQSYEKGKQTGTATGQQARQSVNKAAMEVAKVGKQVVIKIGNTVLTVVTYSAAVLWLIGDTIYKVSAAVSQQLIKLLSATGKVVVGAAQSLGQGVLNAMRKADIAVDKGGQFVGKQLQSMADSTVNAAKWLLTQCKQLGVKAWAGILAGASKIEGIKDQLAGWLASQWKSIQNQVGVAWDQAKNMASGAIQSAKAGVQSAASNIKAGAQAIGNKVADYAGRASGFLQGFLNEMFKRIFSYQSNTVIGVLTESSKFNNRRIIL